MNVENRPRASVGIGTSGAEYGSSKKRLLKVLRDHEIDHPDKPVPMTLKELGDLIGLTRERARQIYKELKKKGYKPPQLVGQKEKADRISENKKVKELVKQGAGFIEIANRERMEPQKLQQVLNRLSNDDRLSIPSHKQELLSRRNVLDGEVEHLREKGYSLDQIVEIIGKNRASIDDILLRIYKRNTDIRYRAKRRSKEELLAFDIQVKKLRGKGLTNGQIAKNLGVSKYFVNYAVQALLKRGEIERK